MSHSVPSSPKSRREVSKSNTMPRPSATVAAEGPVTTRGGGSLTVTNVTSSPRKSRSGPFTTFLKRLSPKLRPGSNLRGGKDKFWYSTESPPLNCQRSNNEDVTMGCSVHPCSLDGSFNPASAAEICAVDTGCGQGPQRPKNLAVEHAHSFAVASGSNRHNILDNHSLSQRSGKAVSEDKQFLFKISPRKVLQELSGKLDRPHSIHTVEMTASTCSTRQKQKDPGHRHQLPTSHVNELKGVHAVPNTLGDAVLSSTLTSTGPPKKEQLVLVPSLNPCQPAITIQETSPPSHDKEDQTSVKIHRTQQPPRSLNLLSRIVVRPPSVDCVSKKMSSLESIGSCSLDVDATASESSAVTDVADGQASSISQRALYSVNVDLGSGPTITISDLSHSPRASRSSDGRRTSHGMSSAAQTLDNNYISELIIPNGGHENLLHINEGIDDQWKQPSYVNISCSVSGYNSYSCYNSKAREELRSRDNSPARLGFPNQGIAQDFSGATTEKWTEHIVHQGVNGTANINGNNRRWSSVDVTDRAARRDVYESESQHLTKCTTKLTSIDTYSNGVGETTVTKEQEIITSDTVGTDEQNTKPQESSEPKSLIQQRIERLYGPGFLAQGFRIQREYQLKKRVSSFDTSVRQNATESSTSSTNTCNFSTRNNPPVFRHLRKNFREQLTAALNTSSLSSSTLVEKNGRSRHIGFQASAPATVEDKLPSKTHPGKVNISILSNGHLDDKIKNGEEEPHVQDAQENSTTLQSSSSGELFSSTRDGHAFIKVMNVERSKIEDLADKAEKDLYSGSLPEESSGRLRAAIGKARLLISQKFEQFRGLCEKNINQTATEQFPTTVSDLAGFWDMVLIQVNEIYSIFDDIEQMRKQGWIVDDKVSKSQDKTASPSVVYNITSSKLAAGSKAKRTIPASVKSSDPSRCSKAEGIKAREEARKRLLEAKRKARQQAVSSAAASKSDSEIEIFLAEKKD